MGMKTIITLLLGLAFQLAQVLPGGVMPPPCATSVESCACCAAGKSCCCATHEQPDPKQSPQPLPNLGLLKGMAMKTAETRVCAETWLGAGLPASLVAALPSAPLAGFEGVPLAVAFCSFVI